MIEVRLDFLDDLLIPDLPLDRGTQFIATFRPRRQGGLFSGSEKERLQVFANFSERTQQVSANLLRLYGLNYKFQDLTRDEKIPLDDFDLEPYAFVCLKA